MTISQIDNAKALPRVAVVILNTNRREDTLACLRSLQEATYPNLAIIVLDNSSTDGSVTAIETEFSQVQIVGLEENHGYAGNNNTGVVLALEQNADWIMVLNEDTIVAPDCITRLVAAGILAPNVGIVGPMLYHADEPHVIQSAGGILDRSWRTHHTGLNQQDAGQFPVVRPVDWVSGCALMIRRGVVEQIGLLDERYFYYWEETDWCLRIGRAGWRILHVPQAKVWHKGVQRDYHPRPSVTYYNTRNRLLLMAKHHAPSVAWIRAWAEMLRTLTSWTVRPKWHSRREHRDAMWRGVMDFLHKHWGQMPS